MATRDSGHARYGIRQMRAAKIDRYKKASVTRTWRSAGPRYACWHQQTLRRQPSSLKGDTEGTIARSRVVGVSRDGPRPTSSPRS